MSETTERRRALREEARRRQHEVLPALREAVKDARAHRRKRMGKVRAWCKRRAVKHAERADRERRKLRERLARLKHDLREACQLAKAKASEEELERLELALQRVQAERETIAEIRSRARMMKDARGRAGGLRAAELRAESDDEVRHELDDDPTLLAVWDRVKGRIRAGKHRSRAEAFFEFLQEHPETVDEVIAAQQAEWDREAEDLLGGLRKVPPARADESEHERYMRDLDRADRALARHPVSTGTDVPF